MDYRSTKSRKDRVCVERAIMAGTAPDGGLYVPIELPVFELGEFANIDSLDAVADVLLRPFFAGSALATELHGICAEALNFPVPLRKLEPALAVLEMFHGPTAAFKDVGARFLAATMARIVAGGQHARPPITILVATSGDTGGAVAAAFHRRPGFRVVVLFPDGRVSARQQHQLTCWGENVLAMAVRGEFDDCQRLAKQAFADEKLAGKHNLCSANSINVGRLLPQVAYYAKASLEHWRATGRRASFIVPSGNLGNGFACVWARQMGLPIDRIVLATNANTTLADFLATGHWLPRPTVPTLASAMDVGNPSNMERLRDLCGDVDAVRAQVQAVPVTDDEIRESIRREYGLHRLPWCPHTATGLHVYRQLAERERHERDWIVVATAHPAKFDTIVEPLIGTRVEPPSELARLLELPARHETIPADLGALAESL